MTNRKTRPRKNRRAHHADCHGSCGHTNRVVQPPPGRSWSVLAAYHRFPSLLGNDNEDLPLIRTLAAVAQLITRPQFPCAGTVEENSTL
jgi:hypothetical protein